MKNIAFVYTEYQQNILFGICLQENVHIDILFVRKDVALQRNANAFVHKVVYFENIHLSWRSVWKYYQEYKKTIAPEIDIKEDYKVFTWSITNPFPRYAINFLHSKNINLFEDGSGSYVKWGTYNYNLGMKTFVISTFVFLFTNIFSLSVVPLKRSWIKGWALFDHCYPDFNIEKNTIEHKYFQKVIRDSLNDKRKNFDIGSNAVIFITSPYVEFGILCEDEYVQIMIESIKKIKKQKKGNLKTIYWKLHPRTNTEDEKIRLRNIQTMTNIHFEILYADSNIEVIALENQEKNLQYYSLGSSSLYVIKALVPDDTRVCLVESEDLKNKLPNQLAINKLYRSIGIEII